MALTLLMARHGQTDLNTDDRWQGRIDAPLNATGFAQAEQLAKALPGAGPTRAVVERVANGLQSLRQQHDGQTVLLVLHGFVVCCLRHVIDGVGEAEFFDVQRIANGGFLTRTPP